MEPVTEVPSSLDTASPPPAGFVVVTWIGAFSALRWMMFLLFGRGLDRTRTPPEPELEPTDADPETEPTESDRAPRA